MKIKEIKARRIFDSNGNDAIEVEVSSDVRKDKASIGAGTSVGKYEVHAYPKNIKKVIELVNNVFNKDLSGLKIEGFGGLKQVEDYVKSHDLSENMEKIGGNVLIALELAILKTISEEPLYKILAKNKIRKMPIPLGNCLEGGKHSGGRGPDFQEFLVLADTKSFEVAAEINREVFHKLKDELKKRDKEFIGGRTIEGGWSCTLNNFDALNAVKKVAEKIGKEYKIKVDVGLDVAADSLWNGRRYEYKNFSKTNPIKILSTEEQIEFIRKTIKSNELIYVEDPFHDNDFDSFKELNKETCYICGDDLTSTNPARLNIALKNISAVIIKPNQIGSLLKVKEVIDIAKDNKIIPIISHRSRESESNDIAHLAVGWGCPIIKTGIVGGERISKLNELIRINESL